MTNDELNVLISKLSKSAYSEIDRIIDEAVFHLMVVEDDEHPCACYYLAKLFESLYEFCSNEDNFNCCEIANSRSLSVLMALKYEERYGYYWNKAIQQGEPHALFDLAMSMRYDVERQDEFRRLLKEAAETGYPMAVYNYAEIIRSENPSKAKELIDSVKHFASVRNEMELKEEMEQREREEELEENAFCAWHDKFVDWREESGWNDVYGSDVDASDIIEF